MIGNFKKFRLELDTVIKPFDCGDKDIDIEWHIEQKLKYNATRENKHGKNY